jgi:hypothetical protein
MSVLGGRWEVDGQNDAIDPKLTSVADGERGGLENSEETQDSRLRYTKP